MCSWAQRPSQRMETICWIWWLLLKRRPPGLKNKPKVKHQRCDSSCRKADFLQPTVVPVACATLYVSVSGRTWEAPELNQCSKFRGRAAGERCAWDYSFLPRHKSDSFLISSGFVAVVLTYPQVFYRKKETHQKENTSLWFTSRYDYVLHN